MELPASFFVTNRIGSNENEFAGHFSWNSEKGKFALSTGSADIPLSGKWAESLVDTFISFEFPVENDRNLVKEFLSEARKAWIEGVDWGNLKWYIRNPAMKGVSASLCGISASKNDGKLRISGFTSGYDAMYALGENGEVHTSGIKQDQHGSVEFWSGYSPPLPLEYNWNFQPGFYFRSDLQDSYRVLIATPNVSEWVKLDPEFNLKFLLEQISPDVAVRNRMKSGKIRNGDTIILIIG